jgi:gliding motility-associated-like protein
VFAGTDQLTIEACDVEAARASNIISIEVNLPASVDPPIKVYNAVSPNNDSKHDYLEIENITAYPNHRVYIFNRWGDKVFELQGYDNASAAFNGTANKGGGSDLPAGTYFLHHRPWKWKRRYFGFPGAEKIIG